MKNLKITGKKFYFKTIGHILIVATIIVLGYLSIKWNIEQVDNEKNKYESYKQEQELVLKDYKTKLDSMECVNAFLEDEQRKINHKIDSISKEQSIINENHEKELDVIRDAALSEHDEWFSAKLDSLRLHYSPGR